MVVCTPERPAGHPWCGDAPPWSLIQVVKAVGPGKSMTRPLVQGWAWAPSWESDWVWFQPPSDWSLEWSKRHRGHLLPLGLESKQVNQEERETQRWEMGWERRRGRKRTKESSVLAYFQGPPTHTLAFGFSGTPVLFLKQRQLFNLITLLWVSVGCS